MLSQKHSFQIGYLGDADGRFTDGEALGGNAAPVHKSREGRAGSCWSM